MAALSPSGCYRFQPDVVISANMPLDAQNILQKAARAQNARFVFWLQDVYSVAARFVLQKKARLLASLGGFYFERLEKSLLQRSDAIVCIAPGFAEFVKRWDVPPEKIAVIPNWAPLDEVVPLPRDNAWARENKVGDKFCFMYSGTLGMKHRPELLLALAQRLETTGNARLIVIAGGAGADWLAANKHRVRSDVLTLLPFQPYERIAEVLASADVLITLLDSEAGAFAVPSKTLSYLCAGRALIVAAPAENEAARVVERAGAGFVVSPDDSAGLIAAAERLLADPALCARYGAGGRAYAEAHFSIQAIADRFLSVLGQPASPAIAAPGPSLKTRLRRNSALVSDSQTAAASGVSPEESTVVLFGGTGFIGTHLAQEWLRAHLAKKILLVDLLPPRNEPYCAGLQQGLADGRVEFVRWDVRQPIPASLLPKADLIFNLAAIHREPGHAAAGVLRNQSPRRGERLRLGVLRPLLPHGLYQQHLALRPV